MAFRAGAVGGCWEEEGRSFRPGSSALRLRARRVMSTIMGVWRHLAKRGVFLAVTLVVAMYLVVLIANAGGKIDEILIAQIKFDTATQLASNQGFRNLNATQQAKILNDTISERIHARGLDRPFAEKSVTYT